MLRRRRATRLALLIARGIFACATLISTLLALSCSLAWFREDDPSKGTVLVRAASLHSFAIATLCSATLLGIFPRRNGGSIRLAKFETARPVLGLFLLGLIFLTIAIFYGNW